VHNTRVPRSRLTLFAFAASFLSALLAASPAAAAGVPTIVRHVATDKKVIALTFDDGYSPTNALKIVAILDQYGATGTFFPYANAAAGSASTWKQIAQRFPIGDHTTTHPNLTKLSAAKVFWEIDNGRQVIEALTGVPMVRMFRPPYMFYNQTVEEQAYAAGFKTMVLWSVDSGDSLHYDDARVYSRAIQGHPGGIVLFHAGPPVTVRVLPQVIQYYKSQGYSFVTVPQLLGIPWAPPAGGGSTTGGPTVCVCTDENQQWWTGPVYVRDTPLYRAAPE
jgi:peptidoglycan/xylan/chitin deacetylase (PgdA/CDA1 family)